MIRKYSLVIEGDSDGYSGYVPELPTILVNGSFYGRLDCPRQRKRSSFITIPRTLIDPPPLTFAKSKLRYRFKAIMPGQRPICSAVKEAT